MYRNAFFVCSFTILYAICVNVFCLHFETIRSFFFNSINIDHADDCWLKWIFGLFFPVDLTNILSGNRFLPYCILIFQFCCLNSICKPYICLNNYDLHICSSSGEKNLLIHTSTIEISCHWFELNWNEMRAFHEIWISQFLWIISRHLHFIWMTINTIKSNDCWHCESINLCL